MNLTIDIVDMLNVIIHPVQTAVIKTTSVQSFAVPKPAGPPEWEYVVNVVTGMARQSNRSAHLAEEFLVAAS